MMLQKKPMFLTFFQKLVIVWKISMTNECKVFKCHLMHAQASVAHSYLRLMEIFKESGFIKNDCGFFDQDWEPSNFSNFLK